MRKKTTLELTINNVLKILNPKWKSFTAYDYDNEPQAIQIAKLYKSLEKANNTKDYLDIRVKLDNLSSSIVNDDKECTIFNDEDLTLLNSDIYTATKRLFQLGEVQLTMKIMDSLYFEACSDRHPYSDGALIIEKIKRWVNYCELVDNYIDYTNTKFNNWNKMKKKDKELYITSLKEYLTIPFLNTNTKQEILAQTLEDSIIDIRNIKVANDFNNLKIQMISDNERLSYYIHFLENYRLNQRLTAMANFLLNLQLPNISTLEIALKVCKNSNFTNKKINL